MKIAIKFHDNDFFLCFYGVLETIKNSRRWKEITEDKERLCKIINEISYGIFLLYQELSGELRSSTKEYLQITPDQILLNDEVVSYLQENDWDNHETYIFDSDLDYENNEPIFSY